VTLSKIQTLDMDTTWEAQYVEPGTPYRDEVSETVPIGWWVTAVDADGEPCGQIHVTDIVDRNGRDVDEQVAKTIAAALNEVTRRG
jgi:hypothetical protein